MTVEELRKEAKALGYNLIKINKPEKLLPCICGCKKREHWARSYKGIRYKILVCPKCGREASGRSEREVRHNWNEMIKGEEE